MLDLGWQEILVICVITVIVVGPKELPKVVRGVSGFVRKIRMIAAEFQTGLTDIANDADVKELQENFNAIKSGSLKNTIASAADPTGVISSSMKEIEQESSFFKETTNQLNSAPDTGTQAIDKNKKLQKTAAKKATKKDASAKKMAKKTAKKAAKKTIKQ